MMLIWSSVAETSGMRRVWLSLRESDKRTSYDKTSTTSAFSQYKRLLQARDGNILKLTSNHKVGGTVLAPLVGPLAFWCMR